MQRIVFNILLNHFFYHFQKIKSNYKQYQEKHIQLL
jgi:hypothetical protein